MIHRTMAWVSVLLGSAHAACALTLDFDRYHFDEAAVDEGESARSGSPNDESLDERRLTPAPVGGANGTSNGSAGAGGNSAEEAAANSAGAAGAGTGEASTGGTGASEADEANEPDEDTPDPAEADATPPPAAEDDATETVTQRTCDQCTSDENCVLGTCRAAATDCAALKLIDPNLGDGVYMLATAGGPVRSYCDMAAQVVLCSDDEGDHAGITRDISRRPFVLRSQLVDGGCRVWNVHSPSDLLPFDALALTSDGEQVDPCVPFGFKPSPDGNTRGPGCAYGNERGTCGFNVSQPMHKYSNLCDCTIPGNFGPGYYPNQFVEQGTIFNSFIPWDASGSISVRCGI